jgi:xanthine dehydrogenase small subunit
MGGAIRFLLGTEERVLADVPPTTTVLEWLRRDARRCGTKEGCAEGDCGACTVVLAEPDGTGGLRHRPVNSCIQFVPALHGRQLLTVEDVAGPGGALHPVQAALVELHGSQCGFCTPGFVMQLYAGWLTGALGSRAAVKDWLAGNLCRCTGYGPIIEAGLRAGAGPGHDGEAARAIAAALADLDDGAMLDIAHGDQRWLTPRSVDELAAVCTAHPDAILVAGATDVGLWVTKQHRHLATLIDTTRIPDLAVIREEPDGIVIGGGASLADAAPALGRLSPDLAELMRRFASIQIRAAGTVGGNVANGSPVGDLPPALIALGATLVLRKGKARREVTLEDFFIDYGKQDRAPGEFVEAVQVSRPPDTARFGCYKLSKRFDQDISAVMGAFRIDLDGDRVAAARLAYGGMAATPKRAARAEAALAGGPFDAAAVERACLALAGDFTPITDMRASADYRLAAAANLLRRFHLEAAGAAPGPTRLRELAP